MLVSLVALSSYINHNSIRRIRRLGLKLNLELNLNNQRLPSSRPR